MLGYHIEVSARNADALMTPAVENDTLSVADVVALALAATVAERSRGAFVDWSAQTGIEADFHCRYSLIDTIPVEAKTVLYRIVQESLTNIAKHAQAIGAGCGNIVARFPATGGDGVPIMFAAHLDTVFPAGTNVTVRRDGTVETVPTVAVAVVPLMWPAFRARLADRAARKAGRRSC